MPRVRILFSLSLYLPERQLQIDDDSVLRKIFHRFLAVDSTSARGYDSTVSFQLCKHAFLDAEKFIPLPCCR